MDKFLNRGNKLLKPIGEGMDIETPEKKALTPWVQKYRPKTLSELTYQYEAIEALKNVLKTGNLPHLLLYGPAGTGKTSAILALAKDLFGPGFYRERILELNASDERGINVIREKVKNFALKQVKKNPDKNFQCPKIKIIILDEADLLTYDAQSALRRIIEDNSMTTRFCIICNYVTKIIEPLASRCVKFRFKSIPRQIQFDKLQEICEKQNVKLDRNSLNILVQKGDLRQSINSLQSLSKLSLIPSHILPAHDEECETIFQNIQKCSTIAEVSQYALDVQAQGFAVDELLNGFYKIIKNMDNQRIESILLQALASCEEKLELGGNELPLLNLFNKMHYTLNLQI